MNKIDMNLVSEANIINKRLEFLVEQAVKAPSSHNTQPWKFNIHNGKLYVWADMSRKLRAADPTNRELYTSIGCAIGNIKLGAQAKGWYLSIEYFPNNSKELVAKIEVNQGIKKKNKELLEAILKRVNNRLPYDQKKIIPEKVLKVWKEIAASEGVILNIVTERVEVSQLAEMTKEGIREALGRSEFRQELSLWLRHNWTKKKDGLPGYTIGMPDVASIMAPILIRSEDVVETTAQGEKDMVEQSFAIGVITADNDDIKSWVKVGETYERIAVEATSKGIATAVLSAAIEVEEQRKKLQKMLGKNSLPMLFFRIGYPIQAAISAPRRGVTEVMAEYQEMTNPFLNVREIYSKDQNKKNDLIEWYLGYKISDYVDIISTKDDDYWQKLGEQRAIELFHQAAENIPAYKDFLAKNGVDPKKIISIEDFKKIPVTDKKNYISCYPLEQLCWNGNLLNNSMISFSSGSTGNPYFWPRGEYQEIEGALAHEHLLTSLFGIDKTSTLIVVTFSMGSYVAGTYTSSSIKWVAAKGYQICMVTPGIDHTEALSMINTLGPKFEQIIICGYPPFVKDMIEMGIKEGVAWKKYKIRFLLASDFFSETWREVLQEEVGGDKDSIVDSTNIYGAADATLFGFETPELILLRKFARNNTELHRNLFGTDLTPTVVQYNPAMRFFEVNDKEELLLTVAGGVPLIRYNLHDQGGLLTAKDRRWILGEFGIDWEKELQSRGGIKSLNNLPAVYLTGRTDEAVSLYGVLIYPDYIKSALEDEQLREKMSGRFTIVTKSNKQHMQYLEVNIELKEGIKYDSDLIELTEKIIRQNLRKSTEYVKLEEAIRQKAKPKIILHIKGESEYFAPGIKQKWIKRN